MNRYRFVEAEKGRYPVTRLCRMAQVSRAAYYQWQEGTGSARAAAGTGASGNPQSARATTPAEFPGDESPQASMDGQPTALRAPGAFPGDLVRIARSVSRPASITRNFAADRGRGTVERRGDLAHRVAGGQAA